MTPRTMRAWMALAVALPILVAPGARAWDRGVGIGRPGGGFGFGGVGGPRAVGAPGYRHGAVVVRPAPLYPSYGVRAAGAFAVGAAAGAGAASAGAPPPAATPQTLRIGSTLAVLPEGCGTALAGGITYYRCGSAWLRPYMQGNAVQYVVVPAP